MSSKKAIEESLKMWQWLAEKCTDHYQWKELEETGVNKRLYFNENNIKEIPFNECYLCEDLKNDSQVDCGQCCFSVFQSDKNSFFCLEPGSPYYGWGYCWSIPAHGIAASKMVKFLIKCLDELDNDLEPRNFRKYKRN